MLTQTRKPPTYRLHATGQAFVQWKGKRFYLGKHGSNESKERYSRFVAEVWSKPAPVQPTSPAPGTDFLIVQLAAAYWCHAEGYYRKDGEPSGQLHIVRIALKVLRDLYAHLPAAQFGPKCLKAIQDHLTRAGKSRSTVNHLCGEIRRAFKWAVAEELAPPSVYEGLRAVSGLKRGRTEAREPEPIIPVPEEALQATLPYLPEVVASMVLVQRATGCRPGEVLAMRPRDIDRTTDPWVYRPESHKTEHHGKDRLIHIGPKAQAVLRPYLLRPADAYCFSPADSEAKRREEMRGRRKTGVQPSQLNRRKPRPKRKPTDHYTKDAYCRAIHRAVDKANQAAVKEATERGEEAPAPIGHWAPNQLRHSAATEIRRLFGLEASQVVLGHAKADTTQIYAERDGKLAAEIARKIG